MEAFNEIKNVIIEILDVEEDQILSETYLIRELGAESIDLLELAVSLNTVFKKEIIDDDIFLRKLRIYLEEAEEINQDKLAYLAEKYPFLEHARIRELLEELGRGPVLKVKDLVSYINYRKRKI